MRAFDAMRQSRRPVDPARVQAIQFLDAALGADRRQLIKQYVENHDSAPKLAERIWQAVYDLSQGFMCAYQTALEEALRRRSNPRWKPLIAAAVRAARPLLRHRRQAARVPLRALDPGQVDRAASHVYLRASELGLERVPDGARQRGPERDAVDGRAGIRLRAADPPAQHRQHVAAAARLGDARRFARWSRRLQLDAVPRSTEGFFVDIAGKTGLVRPHRQRFRARCCAISTRRRSPSRSSARSPRCARPRRTDQGPACVDQPAAHRDPRKGPPVDRAQPQRRTCAAIRASRARSPRSVRIGLDAHLPRARVQKDARRRCARRRAAPSRSRCTRSPTVARARAPRAATSTTRSPRACRRSPIRCGRSRIAASRACASRRPAASARRWRSARSSPCGSRTCPIGCSASCAA